MFKIDNKRIITSIVLLIGLVGYLFIGAIYLEWKDKNIWYVSYIFASITTIFFCLALYEFINLRKQKQWSWYFKILVLILGIILLWIPVSQSFFYDPYGNPNTFETNIKFFRGWMPLLTILIIIIILFSITFFYKKVNFNDIFFILFGLLFLSFSFKAMNYLMLQPGYGWTSIVFLLLIVISNDTFAYLGGSWYGKHKLAPSVSPKKTWEGTLTGMIVALIIVSSYSILLAELAPSYEPFKQFFSSINENRKVWQYSIYIILIIFLSIISQFGDLLFSYFKRQHNVKDFSNLLPGHGGLLDRIDSLSTVLIIIFCFAMISNSTIIL